MSIQSNVPSTTDRSPVEYSILFHKPYNVLSQFTNPDGLDCGTLKDFIALPHLYSVGRLDRDSEGLLLLTNHGALKHRLTHPQFHHPRTYWVQVERVPSEDALVQLRQGVTIKGGYRTAPAGVERLPENFEETTPTLEPRDPPIRFRKTVPTVWLEMTLTEGKNRQVRRMTAAVGHPTLRLVRSRIGLSPSRPLGPAPDLPSCQSSWLTLKGLRPGQWRELTPDESQALSQLAKAPSSERCRSAKPSARSPVSRRSPSGHRSFRRSSTKPRKSKRK